MPGAVGCRALRRHTLQRAARVAAAGARHGGRSARGTGRDPAIGVRDRCRATPETLRVALAAFNLITMRRGRAARGTDRRRRTGGRQAHPGRTGVHGAQGERQPDRRPRGTPQRTDPAGFARTGRAGAGRALGATAAGPSCGHAAPCRSGADTRGSPRQPARADRTPRSVAPDGTAGFVDPPAGEPHPGDGVRGRARRAAGCRPGTPCWSRPSTMSETSRRSWPLPPSWRGEPSRWTFSTARPPPR